MKPTFAASLAAACLLCAPAFAQEQVSTLECDEYADMDNAGQMEMIAALESELAELRDNSDMTAERVHELLAAGCEADDDALIIDVVRDALE